MSIRVRFACGHPAVVAEDFPQAPSCPVCTEGRVQSVVTSRAPIFRGAALGPCASGDPVHIVRPAIVTLKE